MEGTNTNPTNGDGFSANRHMQTFGNNAARPNNSSDNNLYHSTLRSLGRDISASNRRLTAQMAQHVSTAIGRQATPSMVHDVVRAASLINFLNASDLPRDERLRMLQQIQNSDGIHDEVNTTLDIRSDFNTQIPQPTTNASPDSPEMGLALPIDNFRRMRGFTGTEWSLPAIMPVPNHLVRGVRDPIEQELEGNLDPARQTARTRSRITRISKKCLKPPKNERTH